MSKILNFLKKKTSVMALGVIAIAAMIGITPQTVHAEETAPYSLQLTVKDEDGKAVYPASISWQEYSPTPSNPGGLSGDAITLQTNEEGRISVPTENLVLGKSYYFALTNPADTEYDATTSTNTNGYVTVAPELGDDSGHVFQYNSEWTTEIDIVVKKTSTADTAKLNLSFKKYIVGTDHTTLTTPADKQFKFELYKTDEYGTAIGSALATAYNDAEGNVVFDPIEISKSQCEPKNYSWGSSFINLNQDNTAYFHVVLVETSDSFTTDKTFGVSFDGKNNLNLYIPVGKYNKTYYSGSEVTEGTWKNDITFTNDTINYSDELYNLTFNPIKFKVVAKKIYKDADGNDIALADKQFKFVLMGYGKNIDEKTIATGYNDAEGNIIFDNDTTVEAIANNSPDFTSPTSFSLYEVIQGSKDGYENSQFRCETPFYSIWNTSSYSNTLLTKADYETALKGYGNGLTRWDDIKVGNSHFELNGVEYTSYSKLMADANVGDTIKEIGEYYSADHSWTETTTYTVAGSEASKYLSYVSEEKGNIEDNDGTIEMAYTFTNVKKNVATIVISGKKALTDASGAGRTLTAGEFSFELRDSDGNVVDTAKNDKDGNITFAELTFDTVGEYSYTINEVKGTASGITYDESVKTVVIVVTESDGKLVASQQTSL